MSTASARRWLLPAWSVVLALFLLGPALGPGYVLSYDMVWVPDLALRRDFLGVASGLPRAVPSDALVAVVDEVLPGALLQKLVLLGCLVGGGWGAARLVPAGSLAARLVAVSVYQWNPLVAERLLIGHWPILVGYAALPWVIEAAGRWRRTGRFPWHLCWLVPLASLSASAGLATAVAVLAFALTRRWRTAAAVVGLLLSANAPWLVSGILHAGSATTDPAGAEIFALSGEGSMPGPVAALTLGGIWNAEVVPSSREGLLGWVSLAALLVLVVAGARAWLRRTGRRDARGFGVCWLAGFGVAVLTWATPDVVAALAAYVPGGGLLRDGARTLVLCAPLLACLAGAGAARLVAGFSHPGARAVLGATLAVLPVGLLPDAAWGLAGGLRPADYPAAYAEARAAVERELPEAGDGDVLLLPLSSYRQPDWNHGHKVLDPLGRYLNPDYLASDQLVVSEVVIAGEDPRAARAAEALDASSPERVAQELAALGVGIVAVDRGAPGDVPAIAGRSLVDTPELTVLALDDVAPRTVPTSWYVATGAAWLLFLVSVLAGLLAGGLHLASGQRLRRRDRRLGTV